jgi:hypothetical protein
MLFMGPDGTRWILRDSAVLNAEVVLAADLVGVLELGSGLFAFAGEDGTIFLTHGAVGPPIEVRQSLGSLHSVGVGRRAILGIDATGAVVRTTDGGLHRSKVVGLSVPTVSLALRGDGAGLSLDAHSRLAFTTDDGETWSTAPALPVSVRAIALVQDKLEANGEQAPYVFEPKPAPHWTIPPAEPPGKWRLQPRAVPSGLQGAAAVREGHGSVAGGQWSEVVQTGPAEWAFYASGLGDIPARQSPRALHGCVRALLAADDDTISVGCILERDANTMRVFRSHKGGDFEEGPLLAVAHASNEVHEVAASPRLFALAHGVLLVQDACRKSDSESCVAGAKALVTDQNVQAVTASDPRWRLLTARVAPDGTVYAIGAEPSGGGWNLLSSLDGGRVFSATELPEVTACACRPYGERDVALGGGRDGNVAIITDSNMGRWVRYFSSDHGAHISASMLPIDPGGLDLFQEHGFACWGSASDVARWGPGDAWETSDLGATWRSVGAPWTLNTQTPGRASVACGRDGCLIDTYAARLGWDDAGTSATRPGASMREPSSME